MGKYPGFSGTRTGNWIFRDSVFPTKNILKQNSLKTQENRTN